MTTRALVYRTAAAVVCTFFLGALWVADLGGLIPFIPAAAIAPLVLFRRRPRFTAADLHLLYGESP